MKTFVPQLLLSMREYSAAKFGRDLVSGVIVAIIALPLSIALALASGVAPEQGLYTAIVAGFVISLFGGSKVQIAGPTAAFATIVAGVVAKNGMGGLALATLLAGLILVLMGLLRMGSLIKYIPYTITTGFTAGIAVTIVIGQLKDFLGLTTSAAPVETVEKLKAAFLALPTVNWAALGVGALALVILIVGPRFLGKIPPSLVAVVVTAALVQLLGLPVNTIGDLYSISSAPPSFQAPALSFEMVSAVLPDAFTIAVLAAIESLLACVVADEMTRSKHNSNMELVAQGLGNACSALFGGIPATGAIARTAANIKNGGVSPVAGMVHAAVLLLILVLLMPYAALIPMPAIAAILFIVAYNMSGWRTVRDIVRQSPKSDIAVLALTFALTVVFDLVIAIGVGLGLSCLLFMKRMSDVAVIREWRYLDGTESEDGRLKPVPEQAMVLDLIGPLFFGMVDKLPHIGPDPEKRALILRMRGVPAMDVTALKGLRRLLEECRAAEITLLLSHVRTQPLSVMKKSGFFEEVGAENFCPNIDAALERAASL